MATLVLDRSDIEVRVDGAALALYEGGLRSGTVPVKLLERVVLQGNIRLDANVLTRLAGAGVPVILLSKRLSRYAALVLGPAHSDATVRLAQTRLAIDEGWCDGWSRRLIVRKLRGQARCLRSVRALRPDCRKPLIDAENAVNEALNNLLRDEQARAASVRGIEGAAAAAYFRGLTAAFPPALGFRGRNRRPPRDPVNACLSLAYTLLHFDAVSASYAAGLDVMVGFFHRPAFGRESLACDLVEPLRARVDQWVWQLFRERSLRDEHFTRDDSACLLHKAGRARFYQAYETFARGPRKQLRRECSVLARALRARGAPLMVPVDEDQEI